MSQLVGHLTGFRGGVSQARCALTRPGLRASAKGGGAAWKPYLGPLSSSCSFGLCASEVLTPYSALLRMVGWGNPEGTCQHAGGKTLEMNPQMGWGLSLSREYLVLLVEPTCLHLQSRDSKSQIRCLTQCLADDEHR